MAREFKACVVSCLCTTAGRDVVGDTRIVEIDPVDLVIIQVFESGADAAIGTHEMAISAYDTQAQ